MRIVSCRIVVVATLLPLVLAAQDRPRGRELGIPFPGTPGRHNAITDVPGVTVGQVTLMAGQGPIRPGVGPIRTGVTAIHPRGADNLAPVHAGFFSLNGAGEMTGTHWVAESGLLDGPILITGTHSVGVVRDATIAWQVARGQSLVFSLPVVAETFDVLNDANGGHVTAAHVRLALDSARSGPVAEGAVGGGTGMLCNGYKGGIGTTSRVIRLGERSYTLGVLVQCNYGGRLQILGVPMGPVPPERQLCATTRPTRAWIADVPACAATRTGAMHPEPGQVGRGSIIVIVATDAPLLPHQLTRLARRVGLGLGALGSSAGNSSGDLFLAFSTAPAQSWPTSALDAPSLEPIALTMLPHEALGPFFQATVHATEEAVVNAMLAAPAVFDGADGLRAFGLPGERVMTALRKAGLVPPAR